MLDAPRRPRFIACGTSRLADPEAALAEAAAALDLAAAGLVLMLAPLNADTAALTSCTDSVRLLTVTNTSSIICAGLVLTLSSAFTRTLLKRNNGTNLKAFTAAHLIIIVIIFLGLTIFQLSWQVKRRQRRHKTAQLRLWHRHRRAMEIEPF